MIAHLLSEEPRANPDLERQILEFLRSLNCPGLEMCVQLLLQRTGFRNVVIVARKNWRGRSPFGGYDLMAEAWTGTSRLKTLFQVKQSGPLQRRFVDELRGVMLRKGAPHGMIITTESISAPARQAAAMYPGRPVLLVNGQALAHLMVLYRVGIRHLPLAEGDEPMVVDELFFDRLQSLGEAR